MNPRRLLSLRSLPGLLGLLLVTVAVTGCPSVETKNLLPWFRIKTSTTPKIGGLADPVTTEELYVRTFLFWKKLDACLGGVVLNAETVAVSCSEGFERGIAFVRKGETKYEPACGTLASFAQLVPDRSAVDCFDVLEGRAPVVPTTLRYRRVDPARRVVSDVTLALTEPQRAFLGPAARFYDDNNRPYFVSALDASGAEGRDCTLLSVDAGALRTIVAAPDLEISDCYDPSIWSRRIGRTLRKP